MRSASRPAHRRPRRVVGVPSACPILDEDPARAARAPAYRRSSDRLASERDRHDRDRRLSRGVRILMSATGSVGVTDFYMEVVLPALAGRLDQAFPEFAWRRDARGWIATNEEHTHARLGVRAERVVAHGPAPRGFLVHGGEPMLWTAYVSDGVVPRGEAFIRAVKDLAERAGVDTTPIEREAPRDRRAELLETFFEAARRELLSPRGAAARAYLEERGFPAEALERSGLGVVPNPQVPRRALAHAGFGHRE